MLGLAFGLFAAASFAVAFPVSAEEVRVFIPGVAVEIAPAPQFRNTLRDKDRDVEVRRTEGF